MIRSALLTICRGVLAETAASLAKRLGYELARAGQLQSLRDEMAEDERYYTTDLANWRRVVLDAKSALERVAVSTDIVTARIQAKRGLVEIGTFLAVDGDECPFGDAAEEPETKEMVDA